MPSPPTFILFEPAFAHCDSYDGPVIQDAYKAIEKPADSTTAIVQMADNSIATKDVTTMLTKLQQHIGGTITEKYEKVRELEKVKDSSTAEGRAFVAAYVDYTHTLEAIEAVLEHGGHH